MSICSLYTLYMMTVYIFNSMSPRILMNSCHEALVVTCYIILYILHITLHHIYYETLFSAHIEVTARIVLHCDCTLYDYM